MDTYINVNSEITKGESYFDGGLLQLIGWSLLGFLVTTLHLEFVTLGLYVWCMAGK